MPIERSGPQGYEYQYKVSVYFALDNILNDGVELYIEKSGGEDAELSFIENGQKRVIDIQTKKYTPQIDLEEFAKWISHFTDGDSERNLITKLKEDSHRVVVFVTTARCQDDVSLFVSDSKTLYKSKDFPMNGLLVEKIKQQIIDSYDEKTPLSSRRKEYCEKLLGELRTEEFKNIVRRMVVWERCAEDDLETRILTKLNKEFYVPSSLATDVFRKLLEVVIVGRDTREDIIPKVTKLLDQYKGNQIFTPSENDVPRSEYDALKVLIETKGVLLLTGISLCGKTYIAKKIAQEYQNQGYNVRITGDLSGENGAATFLSHISPEDRICILDDPFGHLKLSEDAISVMGNISKLVRDLRPNRKLIVTSRIDLVHKVKGNRELKDCSIHGHFWHELTLEDEATFKNLWISYFGKDNDSLTRYNGVLAYILKNEGGKLIQPGQISHLATTNHDLSILTADKIVHLSRVDSQELATVLSNRGNTCKELFVALGLGANTLISLQITDLAFMLSCDNSYPGLFEERRNWDGIGVGGFENNEPDFPKYSMTYEIEEKYKPEIQYMAQHKYINIDGKNKSILFKHPIYHDICRYIFKAGLEDIFQKEKWINIVIKGLSALHKEVALNTIKFVDGVYADLREDEKKLLRDTVFKALYSIFPSVKDKAISFFDNKFFDLSKEQQREFIDCVKYEESVDNGGILWNNDEPWYNTSSERSFTLTFRSFERTNDKDSEVIKSKFLNGEYIRPKDAWDYLSSRGIFDIDSDNESILTKMLEFDEVFIKERAIFTLFENYAYKYNENQIDKFLDINEHPHVKFNLLKGAMEEWERYSENCKNYILNFMKESMKKLSLVIVMQKFLTDFEDEWGFDYQEVEKYSETQIEGMWNVWYELIIDFLNIYPSEFTRINTPHLSNVIEKSLKYINDSQKVVNIAEAWCNWLDKTSQFRLTDDYANSVSAYLLEGTKNDSAVRAKLVDRLLSAPNTSFLTTNIRYFIDYWAVIADSEKQKVFEVLRSNRNDVKWIKAVALTRYKVPAEVQRELTGDGSILSKSLQEIVNYLDGSLLNACLHVYCGYPQPLWWNGYHHSVSEPWDQIIVQVLIANNEECFEVALRELVGDVILGGGEKFKNGYAIWETLCKSSSQTREKLFKRLLMETIRINSSEKRILWDKLFEYWSDIEKEQYFKIIIENIEGIERYHDDINQIFEVFNKEVFCKEALPKLKNDELVLKICYTMLKTQERSADIDDPTLKEKIQLYDKSFDEIEHQYRNNPTRLYFTNEYLLYTIKKLDYKKGDSLTELVEENRKRLIDKGQEISEKYDDEYNLENWVGR
jgi:hypothetical protein